MGRVDTYDFFNRNESSYGVDFGSNIETLVREAVEQACPSCLDSKIDYLSISSVGKKNLGYPSDRETAYSLINFICKNEECKQVSSVLIEVSICDEHHVIWPVTEQTKREYEQSIIDPYGIGDSWLYSLHERLNFMDYPIRIINTFPEDLFPERAFFSYAKGVNTEIYLNTEKEIECKRLSIWIKSLATKIRAKDDTFFPSARKLLEFLLPIAGGFNKDGRETLSGLMAKFRKVGPFKTEKVLVAGPSVIMKKTLSDALSESIKSFIGNTDPKLVDGAARRAVYSEVFEQTLALNNDFESIEHKLNVHKTHVLLEQLKDILNNHSHENATPKDEDFIIACGLLNDFFCLIEKILAKHYNDKESNK